MESTVTSENEELSPEHSRGKAVTNAISWFHIAPECKKGQWVQSMVCLDLDTPFSFQMEACDH